MEVINLGAAEGFPPLDWDDVTAKLDAKAPPAADSPNSQSTWLTTLNADGSPHTTAVGAIRIDGSFWFQTGSGTRKQRNVERDPRCSLATSIRDCDVVIEARATRISDPDTIARAAQGWADQGWPAEPHPSGAGITAPYNAPLQGPPPWFVYRLDATSATVVSNVEPGGLTRFVF